MRRFPTIIYIYAMKYKITSKEPEGNDVRNVKLFFSRLRAWLIMNSNLKILIHAIIEASNEYLPWK